MRDHFYTKYKHKIVKLPNLLAKLKKKHNKKVVMCHGVFDVVHPGHVRHLVYAKSKADILIVSLTADKFIKKGIYRPHVPEKIRALNLAAFEMIDYVIIDEHITSIDNIKKIKPDFFAKGFEYDPKKKQPIETQEEIITLKKYGGKMIFTPHPIFLKFQNQILNMKNY
jgi:cytidyltransferase-like protein